MAGAAMQQVNCMKMMADAQGIEDKSDKALMQMMAGQMCQQANESMQAAAKNMENRKALGMSDIPKQASMELGSFTLKQGTAEEPKVPMDMATGTSGGSDSASLGDLPAFNPPFLKSNAGKSSDSSDTKEPTGTAPGFNDPTKSSSEVPRAAATVLNPVDRAVLTFDDRAKSGTVTTPVPGLLPGQGSTSFAATRPMTLEEAKRLSTEKELEVLDKGRSSRKEQDKSKSGLYAESGDTSSGKSGGDSGSSGTEAFDSMLSQIMGLGGDPGAGAAGQLGDVLQLPEDSNNKDDEAIHIFQYASYRYQKATYEEGRIKPPRNETPRLSKSSLTPKDPIMTINPSNPGPLIKRSAASQ
jgi:hypothetical protein